MDVEISQETFARLADEARKEGISVENLLRRLMDEHAGSMKTPAKPGPQLPVWRLGATGSLHRRDIYDDVR